MHEYAPAKPYLVYGFAGALWFVVYQYVLR